MVIRFSAYLRLQNGFQLFLLHREIDGRKVFAEVVTRSDMVRKVILRSVPGCVTTNSIRAVAERFVPIGKVWVAEYGPRLGLAFIRFKRRDSAVRAAKLIATKLMEGIPSLDR